MVLEQHPPELAELVARPTAGERVERLAALDKKPLTGNVLLFDPDTSRVHAAQDRTVPPARDLAAHHVLERRHRGRVLLQACDPGIDVREDLAHGADDLRELRGMAERVGDIGDARGAPELARATQPLLKVADDRLP